MNIPSGAVTFLFTDIEGSTKHAQEFQDMLPAVLEKHHSIIEGSVKSNNGFIFKKMGDELCCAFENNADAINAAVDAQIKLNSQKWNGIGIKVRMGIHSGNATWNGNDYTGYISLVRAQRVTSVAHGGQILISNDSYNSAKHKVKDGTSFRDMGERRLKDLVQPMRIYQVISPDLPSDFSPLKSPDARANNLPKQLTSFIGREKEMSDIKKLISEVSLLTLIGPGGTGKTRLLLEAGSELVDAFVNGVWFVELASLNDPLNVVNRIATALNLKEDGSRKIQEVIADFLKEKELLLILDNCEHLLAEVAKISQSLLNSCPKLKIMTSSRESLRIPGEHIYRVPVLSMPDIKGALTPGELNKFEAVRLFTDRAVTVKNDFTVTKENAPAVAKLCLHLDGIPLAIELAAARIKVMSVEKILDNLNNRFQLLTGGRRTSLPRQQTIRALIDWSFDLLSENEKLLFERLSVFTGGWSMEAAMEICSGSGIDEFEIFDLLSNLIDKSIVITKEKDGIIRFNMLETIRQYSFEKLISKNEIYQKHFNYFLKLSESNESADDDLNKSIWNRLMISEHDNLRAAIKWSLENTPEQSAGLVRKVSDYWETKGNYSEAFEISKKILDPAVKISDSERALVTSNVAYMATMLDENEVAENYIKQSLDFFRRAGDDVKTAGALSVYGIISFLKGDHEMAIKHCEESLALIKGKDQKMLEANVKGNLAAFNSSFGNSEYSKKLIAETIVVYRELNNKESLAKALISMGGIYYQTGDLEKARSFFEEGLPILEEINDQYSLSTTFYNLGNLNFAQKKYSDAVDFYEAAMLKSLEYGNSGVHDRSNIKLGEIALVQNNNEKAKEIFISGLKSFKKNSEKLKLILSIYGLGNYYLHEKNYELSAKHYLFAERISEVINYKFSKSRIEENKNIISELKNKLQENEFNVIQDEVMTIDIDNAAEIVLGWSV